MCNDNTYGLPLALVMEEILEWEKPNGKEQNGAEEEPEAEREQDRR